MAKVKALRITAKRDGFRRAGIKHRDHAVDHPLDTLTKAQIETLKGGDPMLVVHEVEINAAEPEKPDGGNGGGAKK